MSTNVNTTNQTALEQLAEHANAKTKARFAEQAANGVVNPIVLADLLDVRPQMIYNYIAKGKFSQEEGAVGSNNTQKKFILLDEANTWAASYLAKRQAKEDKIEAELTAE